MLAGSCPDLRQHLVAEQFDRLEERRVRPAAHVHLDDLPRLAETLVQVENAVGDLVRAAGEYHSATLHVPNPTRARPHPPPRLHTQDTQHPTSPHKHGRSTT